MAVAISCIYLHYHNILMVPIIIIHNEKINTGILVVTLSCVRSYILKKVVFLILAVAILHISSIYLHVTTF